MVGVLLVAAMLLQPQASGTVTGPMPAPAAIANDTGALSHNNGRVPPVARALRITAAPHVDGRLDDAAWTAAEPITEFTQNVPREGQPASERTEVRIVYDDVAVYVGARMFDGEPGRIVAKLGRRDSYTNSDAFTVSFDSYLDHRTSFQFGVNPAGVKSDQITSDDQGFGDDSWDPVWEVVTQVDSLGWTAELRIPLSQLRYPPAAEQVWGVNVSRFIQRKAESAEWAWSAQTERGFASFFGHVFGLAGLPQPRRLELLPYATARQERVPPGDPADPFNDGSRELGNAGLDLKYGLTSNLTVGATFNPDFGQVELDPAFVNLTAFEQFFQERRPFFVEGAGIFNFGGGGGFGGTQYFYSRRVGRTPQGYAPYRGPGTFTDGPDNTTILGAAKLSGRTGGGWTVGLLEAVTAREYATTDSAGVRIRDEVGPVTNYFVGRGKRDFRGGASQIGFMATAVHRDLRDPDLAFLRSAAYAAGLDFSHRFARNRYSVSGSFGASHVRGDTLAIQRAQLSSARYFQRPDAGYVEYKPGRRSLGGWRGALSFGRISGNLTYSVNANATSPGFELNDAGFQTSADDAGTSASVNRRWTRPGKVFRQAQIGFNAGAGWNFGGVRTNTYLGAFGFGQLLNYWNLNASLFASAAALSDGLTRGGPLGYSPASGSVFVGVSTDFRKPWQVFVGVNHFESEIGANFRSVFTEFSWRPSGAVSISMGPGLNYSRTVQQFVMPVVDSTATATFGHRYVFAEIDQRGVDLTTRLDLTVSPTLSLQLFAQPFVSTGDYSRFKELRRPRRADFIVYGEEPGSTLECYDAASGGIPCAGPVAPSYYVADPDGPAPRPSTLIFNPDFAFRSLRGNAVLRWEYRPGSTLFFVWTTSCSAFSGDPRFSVGDDIQHLCQGPSANVVAVKMNYWLSF
jgi:hypothetical protein